MTSDRFPEVLLILPVQREAVHQRVAASIELYLGEDVLYEGGQRVPVPWTGLDVGVRRYHGEVLDKDRIHKRFFRKLERTRADGSAALGPEWDGLRTIFAKVFAAFHDFDNAHICGLARAFHGL